MQNIRKVVVSNDKDGASKVVYDGAVANVEKFIPGVDEALSFNLWATHSSPADLSCDNPEIPSLQPPKNGTIFRILDLPPASRYWNKEGVNFNFAELPQPKERSTASFMTKWGDLMYVIILQGEVTFILDTGEVVLKTGDVLVDRGSHHGWMNHTNEVCRIALIMLDAK